MIQRMQMAARRSGRPTSTILDDSQRNKDDRYPELKLATEIPRPPVNLTPYGQRQWGKLCKVLLDRGALSPDFYLALENICRAYEQLLNIEGIIEKEGEVIYKTVKIAGTGRGKDAEYQKIPDKAHPLRREWNLLWSAIRAGLSDFGLTPASAKATNVRVSTPVGTGQTPVVSSRNRNDDIDIELS